MVVWEGRAGNSTSFIWTPAASLQAQTQDLAFLCSYISHRLLERT